jgi:hypothetical protein
LWHHYGTFFPHIVREMQNIQIMDTICLTLHYTYYLFYCVTNKKYTNHFSHSSLYKLFISIVREIQNIKYCNPFVSLFIIHIIYSIVREIKNIQILDTISLTFHYTNYLFYCVTKYKTYITFLSLFIIQIIYSIVWQNIKHT